MGFIENALHPDRKRQESWRRFSDEAGGFVVSEGLSGRDEIHLPFMGYCIRVSAQSEGRALRTTMTLEYPTDDFQFKIFGWGDRSVPVMHRDPYLNSEFPDLASKAKVAFNNTKKLTNLLASVNLRRCISEATEFFTLEADQNLITLDNRTYGSRDNGLITDVNQLHSILDILKCVFHGMEKMGLKTIKTNTMSKVAVAA